MECKHKSDTIDQMPDGSIICKCGRKWRFPIWYLWDIDDEELLEQEINGIKTSERPTEATS